jgi:hypothetical protein
MREIDMAADSIPDEGTGQPSRNFANDRHALQAGFLMGLMLKHGVDIRPVVDDDGNYTDAYTIRLDGDFLARPYLDIKIRVLPPDGEDTDE